MSVLSVATRFAVAVPDGGYRITCLTDEKHGGLKSRAQVEQEKSLKSVADATEMIEA